MKRGSKETPPELEIEPLLQPRSQGLSSLSPLVVIPTTKGGREERPWERGCLSYISPVFSLLSTTSKLFLGGRLFDARAVCQFTLIRAMYLLDVLS